MEHKPADVLSTWMDRVNADDLEGILALYADSAILIPTFSNRVMNTPDKIRNYFLMLGGRDDLSVALHAKTLEVRPIQGSVFTLSGIYCWRFSVDEELLSFEARFTYLIDLASPRPILHHHSSQIPRTL